MPCYPDESLGQQLGNSQTEMIEKQDIAAGMGLIYCRERKVMISFYDRNIVLLNASATFTGSVELGWLAGSLRHPCARTQNLLLHLAVGARP